MRSRHFGLQNLFAAVSEQPLCERSCAFSRSADLLHHLSGLVVIVQDDGKNAAVTVDDREQIVEIVGHASRQSANGFHLLRLAKLFYQPLCLRDVVSDRLQRPITPRSRWIFLIGEKLTMTVTLLASLRRMTCSEAGVRMPAFSRLRWVANSASLSGGIRTVKRPVHHFGGNISVEAFLCAGFQLVTAPVQIESDDGIL